VGAGRRGSGASAPPAGGIGFGQALRMAAAVAPGRAAALHYQLGRAEELYGRYHITRPLAPSYSPHTVLLKVESYNRFAHAASNFSAAQRLATAADRRAPRLTKVGPGRPKLWANFRALVGILSQIVGPSLAIWANPAQFSFLVISRLRCSDEVRW
jgi:hypothetical protein